MIDFTTAIKDNQIADLIIGLFKDMLQARHKKEYRAEKVILFGSYTTGEAKKDSDVDILDVLPGVWTVHWP